MRKVWFGLAGILILAAVAGLAQEPTLKVEVNLVNLLFTVREKKGGLVGNLTQDDFTVFENGQQQTIKHFVRESDLPLTIGLLIDVSVSQQNLIDVEKNAASQFFQKVLRPKDEAFLISFGPEAELLQDDTNSAKLLRKGLDGLRVEGDVSGYGGLSGPVPTSASRPHGTVLYDAVYLAASDKMRTEVGRKAIVVITDGQDQGSRYKVEQAVEQALRADTIVYSIQYIDYGFYSRGFGMPFVSDGPLKRMAEDTGGRVFRVDKHHSLQDIFDEIQQEMRSQYAVSYTPTNPNKDGSFRTIDIRVNNRKDLKVQARKGYYATAN